MHMTLVESVQGTIWDKEMEDISKKIDYVGLEKVFGMSPKLKENGQNNMIESVKPKSIMLLDLRKAYNMGTEILFFIIAIMLAKVKLSFREIREEIQSLSETLLSESLVQQFLNFIPTKEEMALLSENLDNYAEFGKAEQFYVEIMKIDDYEKRLKAILLKKKFPERSKELLKIIDIVFRASEQVFGCWKLKEILQV